MLLIPLTICWYTYETASGLDSSDYISIGSAVMSYVATTLLGIVAIAQSRKANQLSRLVYLQSEREFVPSFSIANISVTDMSGCAKTALPQIHFCAVDVTPEHCVGYELSIKNYGKHPITNIVIRHVYKIGKKGMTEENEKAIQDIVIFPEEVHSFIICDTPRFSPNGLYNTFVIECANDFGYSSSIELNIDAYHKVGQDKPRYTCKSLRKMGELQ